MKPSVGDMAAQIMAMDELKGKTTSTQPTFEEDTSFYSSDATQQAPDISQVEVPNDFVNSIIEGKAPVIPQSEESTEEVTSVAQPISEVKELKSLIQEVKDLLIEVKQTLSEMTTVGGIGVGPMGDPKKKNDEDEDELKDILKKIKKRRSAK